MPDTELRIHRVGDGDEDSGSLVIAALSEALAEEPRARVAGAILITDGRVHDAGVVPNLPAPLQVLLTGRAADWDRRIVVRNAPAFAIIGEEFKLELRIDEGVPFGVVVEAWSTLSKAGIQVKEVPSRVLLAPEPDEPEAGTEIPDENGDDE